MDARRARDFARGCMRTYCPGRNPSPTTQAWASRKSQQMACEISGLAKVDDELEEEAGGLFQHYGIQILGGIIRGGDDFVIGIA